MKTIYLNSMINIKYVAPMELNIYLIPYLLLIFRAYGTLSFVIAPKEPDVNSRRNQGKDKLR